METVTLVDLAPILGIMLGSMLAFATAIMRYQHVDSTKTRDLVYELIERSSRENREQIEKSSRENRELIEKVHLELSGGLAEVRGELVEVQGGLAEVRGELGRVWSVLGDVKERLARIEGYLERWPKPPPHDGAAEAA